MFQLQSSLQFIRSKNLNWTNKTSWRNRQPPVQATCIPTERHIETPREHEGGKKLLKIDFEMVAYCIQIICLVLDGNLRPPLSRCYLLPTTLTASFLGEGNPWVIRLVGWTGCPIRLVGWTVCPIRLPGWHVTFVCGFSDIRHRTQHTVTAKMSSYCV